MVGYLGLTSPELEAGWTAFRQGLRELGYQEGRSFTLEARWARGDNSRYPALVRDLMERQPAVIFSTCGQALRAIRSVSRAVPVVAVCADPKNFLGEVDSLSRPGGQTTGFTFLAPESVGKRLQLLKELVPKLARIAVLHDAAENWQHYWDEIGRLTPGMGLTVVKVSMQTALDADTAVAAAVRERVGALLVVPGVPTLGGRERIAALAIKHRLPTAFDVRVFAVDGGLFSYGADTRHLYRTAGAGFVDKILKGASAGDLPVQQATKFELVLNLKTARAIGLTVPQSFIGRADEIIE